jgi:hypothetical protein
VNVVDFFGTDRINYDGKQEQIYKQIVSYYVNRALGVPLVLIRNKNT